VGRPEPTSEPVFTTEPTAETWDYVKRGLDDVLETYRNKTTGELVLNDEGRAILRTLKELRGELVSLNPVYGEALNAYAGPAAMKDALQAGRSAFREDAEALGRRFGDMGAAEKDMYRLGALQALKDKLGNADVTRNAAMAAGVLKPNQLARFKEIFPTEKGFREFVATLDRERTMFQTRGAVFGNSTTAKQQAYDRQEEPGLVEQGAQMALTAKTGGLAAVLAAVGRVGQPRMSEPAAEALAAILTNTDQSQLPLIIERLAAEQAKARTSRLAATVSRSAAETTGASASRRD
jgi:hypothetical protein